jgi:general secretion pathway protein G
MNTQSYPLSATLAPELAAFPDLRIRSLRTKRRGAAAFTLVEMLLVLVILAVLAAIVIPKFSGRSQQAKVTAAQSQISSIEMALDAFEVDTGFYPQGSAGLNQLVDPPSNAQNWKGPYLKKGVPADPWGNPYVYTYPGKNNPKGYDLMSVGPDGRAGGDDDITNWDARK